MADPNAYFNHSRASLFLSATVYVIPRLTVKFATTENDYRTSSYTQHTGIIQWMPISHSSDAGATPIITHAYSLQGVVFVVVPGTILK